MIVNLLMLIAGCLLISLSTGSWLLGTGVLCVALVMLNGIGNVMQRMPRLKEAAKPDTRVVRPARRLVPTAIGSMRPDLN